MTNGTHHSGTNVVYATRSTIIFGGLLVAVTIIEIATRILPAFIVVAGVAFLIGLWLILVAFYITESDRWPVVRWIPLKEFGEAIAISAFLALSLDYYLRSRTIQVVVESAAAHYMVYGLPTQVADEVNFVRKLEMLRKGYHVTYTFSRIPGDSEHIVMEKEWSFSIVNYADDPQPFTHRVVPETDPEAPEPSRVMRASARGNDVVPRYDTVDAGSRFVREVTIPPNSANPDNTFEAKTHRVVRLKDRTTDYLVDVPTLDLHVEVNKPPDLDVDVTFGDHKAGSVQRAKPSPNLQTWTLNGAFLPGLVIEVRWLPAPKAKPHVPSN